MKIIGEKEFRKLESSYKKANYVVCDGEERIVIRIGEINPGLDELLRRNEAKSWAFISAHNPYSRPLTAEENNARRDGLKVYLKSVGVSFIEGYGESSGGEWDPEASFLIFGIERESAIQLATGLEQNAIVAGESGGEPELVWCVKVPF